MVSLDTAVIARLQRGEEHFEILVDPHAADQLIEGKDVDILSNLAIDAIFKDSKKGTHASDESLQKIFGTNDVVTIAREIILKGEIQLTTEQRHQMQERKRKRIIDIIVKNAMDPQTKTPHPRQRIELAMDEAGVHIDPFKPVDQQVKAALLMNKVKGNIKVNIIDLPGFGPTKLDTVEDLALLTGAKVINEELGEFMELYKLKFAYKLQAVKDIHLTSHYMHELKANGNKNSVIFLYIIAWFIIIIAWINFVNLLTISSIKRSEEISLRKVLGGTSRQLIRQFLLESLLINSIALLLAFVFIESSFPFFSQLTDIPVNYFMWNKIWFWQSIVLIFLVGTLLAGSYPVWGILSKKIAANLKGGFTGSKRAILLKKVLVIFQFFIAVVLIAGTISVYQQLQYLKSKESGIDKSDILIVNTPRVGSEDILNQRQAFKAELTKYPFVKNVAFSSVIPGKHNMFNRGGIYRLGDDSTSGKNYRITETDHQFLNVYSNILIDGRNFTDDYQTDAGSVIINLAALELLGFEKPNQAIGEKILIRGLENTIIGVIENFHQESPRLDFEPQIFRLAQRFNGYFSIKLSNTKNLKDIQNTIEKHYKNFFPANPFEYFYLEDYYKQQYKSEVRFGKVFGVFSILALFITILGILSLSSFSAAQRRKEIGIRKVMGASINQILFLLSKNYITLLIIAFIIAIPIIHYALNKWLDNFANRMDLSIWIFIIPIILVSILSLITVCYQSIKAARDNPANSLRYE